VDGGGEQQQHTSETRSSRPDSLKTGETRQAIRPARQNPTTDTCEHRRDSYVYAQTDKSTTY
jgi:hypothetical protein